MRAKIFRTNKTTSSQLFTIFAVTSAKAACANARLDAVNGEKTRTTIFARIFANTTRSL